MPLSETYVADSGIAQAHIRKFCQRILGMAASSLKLSRCLRVLSPAAVSPPWKTFMRHGALLKTVLYCKVLYGWVYVYCKNNPRGCGAGAVAAPAHTWKVLTTVLKSPQGPFKLELENRKNKFKFDGTLLHSARMFHRKKKKDFIKHEIYYFNRIAMKVFIIAYIM